MDILENKGDNVRKGKFKYIFRKIFTIFLIAAIAIFLYEIFMEIKDSSTKEEAYGTKLSADEEEKEKSKDISNVIEKVSNAVVGISKIRNIGSSAFLSNSTDDLGLGTGIIVSKKGYILTNHHVIENADKIQVILENKEE